METNQPELYLLEYPEPSRWVDVFWSVPCEPGFYGSGWHSLVLVTVNHKSTLSDLKKSLADQAVNVLALPAGGFTTEQSIALGSVDIKQSQAILKALTIQQPAGQFLISSALSSTLNLTDASQLGRWSIHIGPDATDVITKQKLEIKPISKLLDIPTTPAILVRLITGLRLWIGQSLLVTIPLLIFGWKTLLWGYAALLLGTISQCIVPVLRHIPPWIKVLAVSLLTAIITSIIISALALLPSDLIWRYGVGAWLASFWMGIILRGAST